MRKKTKTKSLNIRLSEWEFNELEKATKLTPFPKGQAAFRADRNSV